MTITRLPFSDFPMLAKTDRIYAEQHPILRNFYKYPVDLESFAQVIADKSKAPIDRKTLVSTLTRQYAQLNPITSGDAPILEKINTLANDNTFTVVTAHQPSLLMGPLYFVYKIFSTIHLAEKLKAAYPENNFVPIFVIGGEDHDFEEVNHISLFGKKLVWQRDEQERGSVGMMHTTSLQAVLAELKPILGESEAAQALFKIIENAYTNHAIYQDATQDLLNQLFGKYGLVVLNMPQESVFILPKKMVCPIIRSMVF